jgi:hypothetical protein
MSPITLLQCFFVALHLFLGAQRLGRLFLILILACVLLFLFLVGAHKNILTNGAGLVSANRKKHLRFSERCTIVGNQTQEPILVLE